MTKLKPLLNEVDIVGRVKEIDLKEGETKKGEENISGTVTISVKEKVDGGIRNHDIKVRVYSNKFKRDGNINGLFTGYKTVMDEYKAIKDVSDKNEADLVHVQGNLELNEFIGKDGAKHSTNRVLAKFFRRIDVDRLKKLKGPKAVVRVEALVSGIIDKVGDDGLPTGDLKLKGMNVDYFGELKDTSEPIVPFEAHVPSRIADVMQNLYDVNDTGKFTLKINNYAQEVDQDELEEVTGFGDTEELRKVKRSFVNNLEVVGGTEPYGEPKALDEEQIKEVKQWRQKALSTLEDGFVPQEKKSENAFGDVPLDAQDFDDDDLDF